MEGPPPGDWHYELITPDLYQAERIRRIYYSGRTPFQDVVVMEGEAFGRSLVLDGKTQSTEVDEFAYHEGLVHPSMIAHREPRSVFVAGGGEGATIREVLKHRTVARVVMVDIDREVVELCREYLPNHHSDSFDDPRVELIHDDCLAYLEKNEESFDVFIIDVPDPLEAGPAYLLYTQEFYALLRDRMRPEGLMVAQSGPTGPSFYEQCFSAVAKTVSSVFPVVALSETFVPSFGSTWGFVIGSLGSDPTSLPIKEVDRRLSQRVTGDLRYFDGTTLKGMASVPKYLRNSVAAEQRIITRDNPLFVV
ncbi:MAG: polyamine aminopropyltransferase [Dehalococcoidia bacterium]|nr:polyamine aminopropyltransferase [Dehalococcoidia bacterium]